MIVRHFTDEDYKKGLDARTWAKLLGYTRPYRLQVAALILIMVFFAILDAVTPILTMYAIDHFAVPRQTQGLGWFAALFALIAAGRGFAVWAMIVTGGRINTHVSYDIRKAGFDHLQELSFSYFDKRPVGWLMSRLTSDAETLGRTLSWGIVDLVWGFALMLMMAAIMLWLNAKLAVVVLLVLPLLVLTTSKFQKKTLEKYRAVRKVNSEITGAFNEGIIGAKTTKTLVREDANLKEFLSHTGKMHDVSVAAACYASLYLPVVLILGAIGSAAALWIGGNGVVAGQVTYGTLVAFLSYATSFFQPLQDLAKRFPELQNSQAAAERIFSMIETQPEIQDSPTASKAKALPDFIGNVQFERVGFAYNPNEPVLEGFSLDVQAGQTVALVGPTGAGKSTIANLACRFYEPTAGTIRIDGHDYRDMPLQWLQSHLGIVQQAPHLFSGSIADNIRYGKLEATEAEIRTAAEMVNAHPFIMELDQGYNFTVNENGANLSTGQKQLLALARVMLANPKLLVLDEATSSVDTETEKLIQSAINKLRANRTSFIIAHRLSTIRAADRILFIDHGRIVEEGDHRHLLRLQGRYHKLYTRQFLDEKETELLG